MQSAPWTRLALVLPCGIASARMQKQPRVSNQFSGLAAHCRLCGVLRSGRPGSGDAAASLARGMGSVEMLDASGDDQSATPTTGASSSGGASPWGSADKSSSSSLLSDATAFQVSSSCSVHQEGLRG